MLECTFVDEDTDCTSREITWVSDLFVISTYPCLDESLNFFGAKNSANFRFCKFSADSFVLWSLGFVMLKKAQVQHHPNLSQNYSISLLFSYSSLKVTYMGAPSSQLHCI